MKNSDINKILLHFLKTIYHFERNVIIKYSLNFQEVYTLQYLKEKQEAYISEIAQELNIMHFAASRLVSRLEKKGYVKKAQKEYDKRVLNVVIAKSGVEIINSIEESHTQAILNNLEENPELDISIFIKTAENIHKILDTKK